MAGDPDVVIAGGGPAGLILACELRLAGADPLVLERLLQISPIPKGNGLVGQIVPVLDYRGLLERFSAEATWAGRVFLPTAKIVQGGREVKVPGLGRLKLLRQVRTPTGVYSLAPLAALDKNAAAGAYIVYAAEHDPAADVGTPMTLDELRASTCRVLGGDLPMTNPQLLSRLIGHSRQAERYRANRILLTGDAAHVFGLGGSLNTGLLDAVNLGWKLAAVIQDRVPDDVLDSYHAERHLAGQRTITQTRAQQALTAGPVAPLSAEGAEALRELFGEALTHPDPLRPIGELLRQPGPLRAVGELIEGSDVRYPMPAGRARPHPLLGKLAPDLRLETHDGITPHAA